MHWNLYIKLLCPILCHLLYPFCEHISLLTRMYTGLKVNVPLCSSFEVWWEMMGYQIPWGSLIAGEKSCMMTGEQKPNLWSSALDLRVCSYDVLFMRIPGHVPTCPIVFNGTMCHSSHHKLKNVWHAIIDAISMWKTCRVARWWINPIGWS